LFGRANGALIEVGRTHYVVNRRDSRGERLREREKEKRETAEKRSKVSKLTRLSRSDDHHRTDRRTERASERERERERERDGKSQPQARAVSLLRRNARKLKVVKSAH
jgi:hypothetical protein